MKNNNHFRPLSALAGALACAGLMYLMSLAQAPRAGQQAGTTLASARIDQLFRLDEADGLFMVPDGKALVVTQVDFPVRYPKMGYLSYNSSNRGLGSTQLLFDSTPVWQHTSVIVSGSNSGGGGYSTESLIKPGLVARAGTSVSLESYDSDGNLMITGGEGVLLGFLLND